MKRILLYIALVVLTFIPPRLFSQDSFLSSHIDSLVRVLPALDNNVDITVSNVSIQEFLRAVANASGINLNVDPSLDITVVNNFKNVKVRDLLLFLEKNYPVKIEVIGSIVNISKKEISSQIETDFKGVKYDSVTNRITLDYYQTDINQVAREITKLTNYNIILAPSVSGQKVSCYLENMPFDGALEQFAFSNNLLVRRPEDGYFILERDKKDEEQDKNLQKNPRERKLNPRGLPGATTENDYELNVVKQKDGTISVYALNAPLLNIIDEVSKQAGVPYFIADKLEGTLSAKYENVNFETFLTNALKGSKYIYQKDHDIYIVGANDSGNLKGCKVFQFQNRTIDGIIDIIPGDLKENLIISEFPDLNSLVISGADYKIFKLTNLLSEIDQTVPVILIEVIIVNVSTSYTISTGIDAGLGDQPTETKGNIFPKLDIQIGADEINKILRKFNGFGVINMGNVNENFYVTLKALEEQGILNVTSTPKLATLNGHEASMAIGNTEYYLEEQSNYIGTQNPQLSTIQTYKPVNAELALTIKPMVSGDDQITLNIEVDQSDFTERISKTAPPGSVSRNFKSMIRVKNQETIILGGLEEKRKQDSSSGVPFFSRIPLLKWLFSSRTKTDSNSRLSIFIKPTIIG